MWSESTDDIGGTEVFSKSMQCFSEIRLRFGAQFRATQRNAPYVHTYQAWTVDSMRNHSHEYSTEKHIFVAILPSLSRR